MDIPIYVYNFHTCHPKKCTANLLVHTKNAKEITIKRISHKSIVLTPFSQVALSKEDLPLATRYGLVVVDCSWNNISEGKSVLEKGTGRALPFLVPANPINYGVPSKLSTLEAVAASLYMLNDKQRALQILELVKWGEEFFKINKSYLEKYAKARTSKEVVGEQNKILAQLYDKERKKNH
ncbi:MAG: DUF367 family protein [Candidatus Heimdallarchaeaceae archaeon]